MTTEVQTRPQPARTLVEEMTGEAADLRGEIYTETGALPYHLFLVTRSWSGGSAGRGQVTETRKELGVNSAAGGAQVPGVSVTLDGQFSRAIQGTVDRGSAIVERIDGRHTEAELVNFGRLDVGEESFYEIVQDGRDGGPPDRPVARYTLEGRPRRVGIGLTWTLFLKAQEPSGTFGSQDGSSP